MKFKTFMPVLALAYVCAVGQADAAQDRLMMPEQPAEPLNVIEAEVAIPVPSEEVRDVVNAFTQFQLDQKGKYIMDDSRVMKVLNWTMRNKSSISWIAIQPMYMMMNCVST
ncbi:MAG: hypothetical protein E6379_05315 [Veillonella parvula]|nr:hypothetical protein [Veillonella parvula]MDU6948894.1 hypothetical protein [Veillonella parvula]